MYGLCVFKTALHVFVPAFKKVTFGEKVKVGDFVLCAVYPCMLSVLYACFHFVCALQLHMLWMDR